MAAGCWALGPVAMQIPTLYHEALAPLQEQVRCTQAEAQLEGPHHLQTQCYPRHQRVRKRHWQVGSLPKELVHVRHTASAHLALPLP